MFGHEEVARLFIENGANVNTILHVGPRFPSCTPLHLASALGNSSLVLSLLQNGGAVGARAEFGRTPLHWALHPKDRCFRNRPRNAGDLVATVRALLKYGADPQAKDRWGIRPKDFARSYPEIDLLRLLEINTLNQADADALEDDMRSRLQTPGSWTWRNRQEAWL